MLLQPAVCVEDADRIALVPWFSDMFAVAAVFGQLYRHADISVIVQVVFEQDLVDRCLNVVAWVVDAGLEVDQYPLPVDSTPAVKRSSDAENFS